MIKVGVRLKALTSATASFDHPFPLSKNLLCLLGEPNAQMLLHKVDKTRSRQVLWPFAPPAKATKLDNRSHTACALPLPMMRGCRWTTALHLCPFQWILTESIPLG
jgi:hypothetical protein